MSKGFTNIFFSADHHFNHANIIKYCNRPYNNVEEMNEDLINRWNSKVQPGDLVYYLGDFGWKNNAPILDKLNGSIILIKGSHDRSNEIKHKKIVNIHPLLNTRIEDIPITMCHYNMRTWHLSHYNSYLAYGHSHGRLHGGDLDKHLGKSWDVGVDNNGYELLSWDDIKQIMKQRPDNFNKVEGRSFA